MAVYSWHKIKPPHGSYIDYSHPLADSLELCFLCNDKRDSIRMLQPPNAIVKRTMITVGGYPTNFPSGICLRGRFFSTISSAANYTPSSKPQASEVALLYGANLSTFTDNKVTWRNNYLGIVKIYAASNIGIRWEGMSTTERAIGAWPSSKFLAVGAGYRTYSSGGTKGMRFGYYNGVLRLNVGEEAHDRVSTSLNWSTNSLGLCAGAGDLHGYFRWNRLLSAGEHAWMAEQPWDFIKWPKPPVSYWIMPPKPKVVTLMSGRPFLAFRRR